MLGLALLLFPGLGIVFFGKQKGVKKVMILFACAGMIMIFASCDEELEIQEYFVLTGHLGQPLVAADSGANVVWSTSYTPFGETVSLNENGLQLNFRLPGQYYDAETGLYYNWHRYYMPEIGRYLQNDRITKNNSHYTYSDNNPISHSDPSGLMTCKQMKKCADIANSGCCPHSKWLMDAYKKKGGGFYCRKSKPNDICGQAYHKNRDERSARTFGIPAEKLPLVVSWDTECDGDPCQTFYHEMVHMVFDIRDNPSGNPNENLPDILGDNWNNRMRKNCGYPDKEPDGGGESSGNGNC